jgi:hypothetical protein
MFVYLASDRDGALQPAWIAYASHDFEGADLRRRWDDPDLAFSGCHPVVFAGAGSHASYFLPGEYVIAVELKPLRPLVTLTGYLRRFWRDTLGQGDPVGLTQGVNELIKVPFVDYARGDGLRIGPGEAREWAPVVIDDDVPWVEKYRGLWGLDTHDLLEGELAPAGPKYNRDGSVRQTWYDPIGWCELDQEPPPAAAASDLQARVETLREEAAAASAQAQDIREVLPQLHLEAEALHGIGALDKLLGEREARIAEIETELKRLTSLEVELSAAAAACERLYERARAGYRPGPKDHIRHYQAPEPAQTFREGRIAELWAAGSVGILLLVGAVLIYFEAPWFTALLLLAGGAILADNILRGTVVGFLLSVTIGLAMVTTVLLVIHFFWWLALAALAIAGLTIIANNLRELRGR